MTRLTMTLAAALAATLMAVPVMAACTATITEMEGGAITDLGNHMTATESREQARAMSCGKGPILRSHMILK